MLRVGVMRSENTELKRTAKLFLAFCREKLLVLNHHGKVGCYFLLFLLGCVTGRHKFIIHFRQTVNTGNFNPA